MIFLYCGTGLTVILALFSLSRDFPYLRALSIAVLIGLGLSWWQHKNNKKVPHLKTVINVLLIILTVRALLPFFTRSKDILTGLIQAWIFFLILSTFSVYSKRNHYLIQTLSLGLILFSCFSQPKQPTVVLNYILAFFIVWMITLRGMSLLQDIKELGDFIHTKKWFTRELKIGAVFIFTVTIFTVPLYLSLPRFDVPIPFLSRIIEQKYSVSYTDFPRENLVSFLSPSEEKLTGSPEEDKAVKFKREGSEIFIAYSKQKKKPIFWHSPEEYENKLNELKEQIEQLNQNLEKIDKQLSEISQNKNILKSAKIKIFPRLRNQ
jgi:hypothetical protein